MWFVIFILGTFFITVLISLKALRRLTHPKRKEILFQPEEFGFKLDNDYRNIELESLEEATKLKGWFFSSRSSTGKTIVLVHGYGDNRLMFKDKTFTLIKELIEFGYSVVVFDFRNHGESSGNLTTVGLLEQHDLEAVIAWVKKLKGINEKIILWGFSMGAATSLLVGCRSDKVSAIIADSPFADLRNYLHENLPQWSKLPAFPFSNIIILLSPFVYGFRLEDVSPINALKETSGKNILLVHGEQDTTIPFDMSKQLYEIGKQKNNIISWLPFESRHVETYEIYGIEYVKRVHAFLTKI